CIRKSREGKKCTSFAVNCSILSGRIDHKRTPPQQGVCNLRVASGERPVGLVDSGEGKYIF
ncbi:MAG: hypothetical protein KKE17_05360, partial [Proteobacteria bacterium]|nr:hypothetical protein [Pseudomonadota bacterium]